MTNVPAMKTKPQNPLPLLLMMFLLFLLSNGANAQMEKSEADSLLAALDSAEIERIENLIQYGPHRKNPNAAGRVVYINRTAPAASTKPVARLTGPTYKNRRPVVTMDSVRPAVTKRKLTGPRHKNRSAKSRRQ